MATSPRARRRQVRLAWLAPSEANVVDTHGGLLRGHGYLPISLGDLGALAALAFDPAGLLPYIERRRVCGIVLGAGCNSPPAVMEFAVFSALPARERSAWQRSADPV